MAYPKETSVTDLLALRAAVAPFLVPFNWTEHPIIYEEVRNVDHERLIETILGLRDGLKGSNIRGPYHVHVPSGTNLKAQYTDGIDDLGTLEERILRIPDVRSVSVGKLTVTQIVPLPV